MHSAMSRRRDASSVARPMVAPALGAQSRRRPGRRESGACRGGELRPRRSGPGDGRRRGGRGGASRARSDDVGGPRPQRARVRAARSHLGLPEVHVTFEWTETSSSGTPGRPSRRASRRASPSRVTPRRGRRYGDVQLRVRCPYEGESPGGRPRRCSAHGRGRHRGDHVADTIGVAAPFTAWRRSSPWSSATSASRRASTSTTQRRGTALACVSRRSNPVRRWWTDRLVGSAAAPSPRGAGQRRDRGRGVPHRARGDRDRRRPRRADPDGPLARLGARPRPSRTCAAGGPLALGSGGRGRRRRVVEARQVLPPRLGHGVEREADEEHRRWWTRRPQQAHVGLFSSRSALRRLQAAHAVTTFSRESPPRERGTTWSSVDDGRSCRRSTHSASRHGRRARAARCGVSPTAGRGRSSRSRITCGPHVGVRGRPERLVEALDDLRPCPSRRARAHAVSSTR